ncbi:MAG: PAC2 family protein [Nitrososphaeraceae archaeon]
MSTQHNGKRLSSSKIQEKNILAGETSDYSLHDKDKSGTEGKTTVRPLAKVIENKIKLDSPILIAGFPGPGLVGSISTSYIINRLRMEQIACVESEFIVPGVIYAEGKLRHPFRLYSNEEGNVCVLVCEAPIMIQGMHSVLDTVTKWALNNKVKQVMVLDGIAAEGIPNLKRTPIIMSSDGEVADAASLIQDIEGPNDKEAQAGYDSERNIYPTTAYIGGLAGGLLSSCLSNGLASKALFISSTRGIPDPEGAAILLESLDKITDNKSLEIDTQHLRKQGVALRARMEKIIQSLRGQQQQPQEGGAQDEDRIRDGVMYG